uniref:probable G-protein coupled receptor 139 n=1 Tax=Pristiophorus japonicus TaxID=55135 RepID=UPI00398EBAA1
MYLGINEFIILTFVFEIEKIYYPILAVVGVTANSMTIVILSRGKCGLSKCVTRYLVAMAAADLLVVTTDLILRQIPIVHHLYFVRGIPVCNIHAVLLYVATDCSVWFTVTFTFDRFVAICCQKLKTKYCTEKTAAVVLGAVTVLSCLKNIFWYFMYLPWYRLANTPWFCYVSVLVMISRLWVTLELLHSILTPCIPFVLILLLNALTIRHILVASRVRRRLRNHSSEGIASDIEMERRRKSIILLLIISGSFILLWAVFMLFSIWNRLSYFVLDTIHLPAYMKEIGFMLQLLSCCTNTCIYAVTQNKFREQLKNVVKCLYLRIVKIIKWTLIIILNEQWSQQRHLADTIGDFTAFQITKVLYYSLLSVTRRISNLCRHCTLITVGFNFASKSAVRYFIKCLVKIRQVSQARFAFVKLD